jgi:hypothetical protein
MSEDTYVFNKDNPHTRGTPTARPLTGIDAADALKGPSAGDKVSATTKLEKQ